MLPGEFRPAGKALPQAVAVIALLRRGVYLGCIVFGSENDARFQVDMATYFLDRLGKVLSVCMENTLNYEQLRRSSLFDKSVLEISEGKRLQFTVSIGVSTFIVGQPGMLK